MVELYNSKLGDKPKHYRFKELSIDNQLNHGVNNQSFRIWCVRRQILYTGTSLTPLLNTLGAKGSLSDSTTEIVIFFYRAIGGTNEVFAIADGVSAWHLFSVYRDSTFARLAAKRMMAKPISQLRTRPLVGHKTQTESTHDGFYFLEETKQGLAWIEGVKARIKAEALPASFRRLHQKPPELTMQEKSLKFHCSFTFEEWCILLDHLTTLVQEAPADQDTLEFEFLTSLQPANLTSASALEEALCREVWRVFSAQERVETALRFAPLNNEDYHQAEAYSYSRIKASSSNTWSQQLTTHELIDKLMIKKSFKNIKKQLNKNGLVKNSEELCSRFVSKVKSVKIYYSRKGKDRSCVFIRCLQGEVFLSSSCEHFFQVKGQWLKPHFDFFASLHRSFTELLDRSLIRPGHPYYNGHLPKPWMGHSSVKSGREDVEGKYNLSYIDESGFIVGDKACPHSVELFDLLFHDSAKNILYLYQVKEKFGGGARAAAFQLMGAADGIQAIRNGDKTWLDLFSRELQQHNKSAYDHFTAWGGVVKLEQLIQSTPPKNIVFVYALADASSKKRELSDELQLVRRLNPSDLTGCLSKLSTNEHTPQQLLGYLQAANFVDSEGRVTTQGLTCFDKGEKSRFSQELSKYLFSESDCELIYTHLRQLVASKFNSSIPRFSMVKTARHIEKHFSFAIDQIGLDRDLLPPIDSFGTILALPSLNVSNHPEWAPGSTFTWESNTYTLEPTLNDHGLSVLHALLGAWDEEEGAYEWSVDSPKEVLVKKIRKKLQKERTQDSSPLDDAIHAAVARFFYYGVQKRAPMSKNVATFFKWLEKNKTKKMQVDSYLKTLSEYERKYPKSKSLKGRELEILKKTISDLKGIRGQGTAKYPNDFIRILSGTERINQQKRIQKIVQYEGDEELLKEDYQKNRQQIGKFLLDSTPQGSDDEQLKKIFLEEQAEQQRAKQFAELNPIELFLESLVFESRIYGLEEANVIRLLAKETSQIYKADSPEPHRVQLAGEKVGSGKIIRHIFFSHSTIETRFFVCSSSNDSLAKLLPSSLESMDYEDEEICTPEPTDSPSWMSLTNIGNSCYLDATLQVLFTSQAIQNRFRNYKGGHEKIKIELLLLLDGLSTNQESLKHALFSSKLHPELIMDEYTSQQDAAYIVELLTSEFFPELPIKVYRTTPRYPGLTFPSMHDPFYYLQSSISFNSCLEKAICQTFVEEVDDFENCWNCNPTEGKIALGVISEQDAEIFRKDPIRKILKYKNHLRLEEMPEVLLVQLKRFHWTGNQVIKLMHEIRLPEDGILYVTDQGPIARESYLEYSGIKSCYQVVGYIVHHGSQLSSGHYKAFLKHNRQYYECDDHKKTVMMTEEQFLSRRDAYIVVLEKC